MSATAELQSVLSCDNKPFMNSMNQAVAKGKSAGAEIGGAFKGIGAGLAGAFSAGAALNFAKGIIDMGGELQDSSDRLNMTVESIQGLGHAFSQSGANQEVFEKGMVKLNQSIDDALDGSEKAMESFRRLGVSMTQVKNSTPEEIIYLMADGMKGAKNPTEALAAAMDILGKAGAKLVPGLKGGADGLEELANSAAKLTDADVKRLDDYGDSLAALWQKAKVFAAKGLLAIGDIGKMAPDDFAPGYNPEPSPIPGDTGYAAPEEEKSDEKKFARGRKWSKQEEEWADDLMKREEDEAEFVEKDLKNRQALAKELQGIQEETWAIQQEALKDGMSSEELITQLTKDRAAWLEKAVRYEREIGSIHQKDAAIARQQAAIIARKIKAEQVSGEKSPSKSFFEQNAEGMREDMIRRFMHGGEGQAQPIPFRRGGGLTTGQLTTGHLGSTGGLNGEAYHKIRRGDATAAKEAKKQEMANANKGIEDKLTTVIGLLDTKSGVGN